MSLGDAEVMALEVSRGSGLDDRPDADPSVIAAEYLGLTLAPWPGIDPRLVGDRIEYPSDVPLASQLYWIGHETGHWLVRDAGWRLSHDDEERVASRIGCALLLPRRAFDRDLYRYGLDVAALHVLWPLATQWVIARRITELRPAVAIRRTRSGRRAELVASEGLSTRTVGPAKVWPLEDGTSIELVDAG